MDDVARLGFAISSESIEKASADLDRMSDASKRAEGAAASLGTTTDREMRKVGGSARSLERILAGMTGIEGAIRDMQRDFAAYAAGAQKMEAANNNISRSATSASAALRQQRTDAASVVLATDQVTAAINRQNAAAAAHAQREQTRRAAGLNVWGDAPASPVAAVLPEVLTTVPVKPAPATGGNTLPEVERSATAAANAGKMANSVLRDAAFAAASMLLPVSALQFGIFTLSGMAMEWAQQMLTGASATERTLEKHKTLIDEIAKAYPSAAAAARQYQDEAAKLPQSVVIAELDDQLEANSAAAKSAVNDLSGWLRLASEANGRYGADAEAIFAELAKGLEDSGLTAAQVGERLGRMRLNPSLSDDAKDFATEFGKAADEAARLQAAVQAAEAAKAAFFGGPPGARYDAGQAQTRYMGDQASSLFYARRQLELELREIEARSPAELAALARDRQAARQVTGRDSDEVLRFREGAAARLAMARSEESLTRTQDDRLRSLQQASAAQKLDIALIGISTPAVASGSLSHPELNAIEQMEKFR